MGICKFVDELNRLRKSSSDSIDNVEKFDDFKKYMHVTRNVEEDLIEILNKVNESGKKTLVLLCGSAGDGKSHLLSYLKNEEKLLDGYEVYNDATESSSPSKTAIETLNEILTGFSDENLALSGKNIILAINLGVLSNFIESEYGSAFHKLYEYVNQNNILTNQINEGGYNRGSNFQHVSFSDYHMYTLTQEGIKPIYIESIMEKVFAASEDNPFYINSRQCIQCPISQKCPVKHNYEFMGNEAQRKYVANALVEIMVKEKEILTTREILNFIYDILVTHSFSYKRISELTANADYLTEYIKSITPTLMYDHKDRSELLNHMRKYDPLLKRSEKADEQAIFYYISMDVSKEIRNVVEDKSYEMIWC